FAKLEVRELTLPVGQRLGNAVDQDFDAADGERGATAEAADGAALRLREVVAVGGVDARKIPEGFIEAPRRARATDLVAIDGLDGLRHLRQGQRGPRNGNRGRRKPEGLR